jgi:hypothetical protein
VLLGVLPIVPSSLGKHVDEVFPGLARASLSNVDARKWYLGMEAQIRGMLDTSRSLEMQARMAFDLRNQFRTWARELMADRDLAMRLLQDEPNLSWEQIVA